jgi:tRNA(Ile)-lysidine synthase
VTGGPAALIDGAEFAALMASLGPFEDSPRIAAAVSGGADSLALALLLHDWARPLGGHVTALTVDHGLRPEAAAEARFVARTLKPLGLTQQTLRRRGAKPEANISAALRRARYDLLSRCCARRGLLHLALAHHLDDQAETFLLRLGRGSGLDGLAAMSPIVELPALRLLRPLLGLPKVRLEATLRARGLSWVEDPTNRDPAQARARLRRLMPGFAREGLTAARLAAVTRQLGRARAALERELARLLVRAVTLDPAGFAWLDPGPLVAAPAELGLRALARVLTTVGGAEYGPRLDSLERLHGRISAGLRAGATLGSCRVLPRRGRLLVVREARNLPVIRLASGHKQLWDGRFELALRRAAGSGATGKLDLGALGDFLGAGAWAEVRRAAPAAAAARIPAPARAALPALSDGLGLLAVPHLGYRRPDWPATGLKSCRFRPKNALINSAFTVA